MSNSKAKPNPYPQNSAYKNHLTFTTQRQTTKYLNCGICILIFGFFRFFLSAFTLFFNLPGPDDPSISLVNLGPDRLAAFSLSVFFRFLFFFLISTWQKGFCFFFILIEVSVRLCFELTTSSPACVLLFFLFFPDVILSISFRIFLLKVDFPLDWYEGSPTLVRLSLSWVLGASDLLKLSLWSKLRLLSPRLLDRLSVSGGSASSLGGKSLFWSKWWSVWRGSWESCCQKGVVSGLNPGWNWPEWRLLGAGRLYWGTQGGSGSIRVLSSCSACWMIFLGMSFLNFLNLKLYDL